MSGMTMMMMMMMMRRRRRRRWEEWEEGGVMMRGEGETVEGSPCRSRFGCRCASWRMGSSSGAMSGALRAPLWAAPATANTRPRSAVADRCETAVAACTGAYHSESEEPSDFDSSCNARSQVGDSQDECAPFRPRSTVADRGPLPGRQKCWPDSSDKEIIGSEPRQT